MLDQVLAVFEMAPDYDKEAMFSLPSAKQPHCGLIRAGWGLLSLPEAGSEQEASQLQSQAKRAEYGIEEDQGGRKPAEFHVPRPRGQEQVQKDAELLGGPFRQAKVEQSGLQRSWRVGGSGKEVARCGGQFCGKIRRQRRVQKEAAGTQAAP